MFESRANRHVDEVAIEARDRQRAIAEHEKREKVLDSCPHCLDSQVIIITFDELCFLNSLLMLCF